MTTLSIGRIATGPQSSCRISSDDFHLFHQDLETWPPVQSLEVDFTALLLKAEQVSMRRLAEIAAAQAALSSPGGGNAESRETTAPAEALGPAHGWPPGRAGRIARFIFSSSYSPIPEVAVTATLALLAGVCGRAYRTPTEKDLALFIILVAKSGVGKDAIHEGIPAMLDLADCRGSQYFVRSCDFASGEALHKQLLREPGFLYLQGEFGRRLKRMSNPTDTPMQSLRTTMLNGFGKRFLEGKSYSNEENSLEGVYWPALSFLGETVPGTFFECLTPDMMADGFMSRFLVIFYGGDKPRPNPNYRSPPPLEPDDLLAWRGLVDSATPYQAAAGMPPARVVGVSQDAAEKLTHFELEAVAAVNSTEDESVRQSWNRAHLKLLKVASILAVADNWITPRIEIHHVAWSRGLITNDIELFLSRQKSGDIGTNDDARERKLIQIMREYVISAPPQSYKIPKNLVDAQIIPRLYLQKRVNSVSSFNNHKSGSSKHLDETIRSLTSSGYIKPVKKEELETYGFHGAAYRLLIVE